MNSTQPILFNNLEHLKFCNNNVGAYGAPIWDEFPQGCLCIGQSREDGEVDWVLTLHSFKGVHDCMLELVLNHEGMFTKDKFIALATICFNWIFNQIGLLRCSTTVRVSNKASIKLTKALGMRVEGMKRLGFMCPKPEDMVLFGMLRDECRWIQRAGAENV
jgi:hypothetical protein